MLFGWVLLVGHSLAKFFMTLDRVSVGRKLPGCASQDWAAVSEPHVYLGGQCHSSVLLGQLTQ